MYRKKNSAVRVRNLVVIALAVICVAVLAVFGSTLKRGHSTAVVNITAGDSPAKCKTIIRAKENLASGEIADLAKFEPVSVSEDLVPADAVCSIAELKGKRLKYNISQKEFILAKDLVQQNEWYEDGDRLIEHNFPEGAIPATVEAGSTIDVKLFREGAEDAVVISKVVVLSRNAGLLAFYLNSSEQENIKEASAEGKLFAVQYIDSSQAPSKITYFPSYKRKTLAAADKGTSASFKSAPELH